MAESGRARAYLYVERIRLDCPAEDEEPLAEVGELPHASQLVEHRRFRGRLGGSPIHLVEGPLPCGHHVGGDPGEDLDPRANDAARPMRDSSEWGTKGAMGRKSKWRGDNRRLRVGKTGGSCLLSLTSRSAMAAAPPERAQKVSRLGEALGRDARTRLAANKGWIKLIGPRADGTILSPRV